MGIYYVCVEIDGDEERKRDFVKFKLYDVRSFVIRKGFLKCYVME